MKCPKCDRTVSPNNSYCESCGASLSDDISTPTQSLKQGSRGEQLGLNPGDSFGERYRIIAELGRGGMAVVYQAEDLELGIEVALKIIRPEFLVNERFVSRFKKEILLAREITHENVVRIYDFAEHEGIKFITMEHIEGKNLKEILRESGPLDIDRATDIFTQVCSGLAAAHKVGVIHRDLKAQNIMMDQSGHAYITDFGLAKTLDGQELSVSGAVVGTPEYISPEQASGQAVDQRSDIYTLGLIFYEMVTGRLPYKAATTMGYLQKHLHEQPLNPALFREDLPDYLEKIILRCLAKIPLDRYASVDLLKKDITNQAVTPVIGGARWVKKMILPLFLVLLILTAIFVGYNIFKPTRSMVQGVDLKKGRKTVAVVNFKNKTGDTSLDHWQDALQDLLMTDLAQSLYFRVLPESRLFQALKDSKMVEITAYYTDSLRKIASQGSIDYIIYGSYITDGQKIRTTARVWSAVQDDEVDTVYAEAPDKDHLYAIVDQLTRKIKYSFRLTEEEIAKDIDREIGKITTNSQEAYGFYIKGKKLYLDLKYQESIQAFKKATRIDPQFALAYRRIAESYSYLGKNKEAIHFIQKAMTLLDHISEREQYLIKGYEAWFLNEDEIRAIDYYRKLLKIYPDDETGLLYIGSIYRNQENWDEALKWFEKLRSVNENSTIAYINLNTIFKAKGWYQKCIDLLKNKEHLFADKKLLYYRFMLIYMCQGKYTLALSELERARIENPEDYRLAEYRGNIYQLQEKFYDAEKEYRQLLNHDSVTVRLKGFYWLGYLNLAMGRFKKCEANIKQGILLATENNIQASVQGLILLEVYLNIQRGKFGSASRILGKLSRDSAWPLPVEIQLSAHHLRGIVQLKQNNINGAQQTIEQLKNDFIRRGYIKGKRAYYYLQSVKKSLKERMKEAAGDLQNAINLLPSQRSQYDNHALYWEELASIYQQKQDLVSARKAYEMIVSLSVSKLRWGYISMLAYYKLGKIFQTMGWNGKAQEHYRRFLTLWEEADPGIKELVDAKKQLNKLLILK